MGAASIEIQKFLFNPSGLFQKVLKENAAQSYENEDERKVSSGWSLK